MSCLEAGGGCGVIDMQQRPDERKRGNRGCPWVAQATVAGRGFIAASRSGAPFALARVLVAESVPDQSVRVVTAGLTGAMVYRSLYEMAGRTIEEGANVPARLSRYQEWPREVEGSPKNGGE